MNIFSNSNKETCICFPFACPTKWPNYDDKQQLLNGFYFYDKKYDRRYNITLPPPGFATKLNDNGIYDPAVSHTDYTMEGTEFDNVVEYDLDFIWNNLPIIYLPTNYRTHLFYNKNNHSFIFNTDDETSCTINMTRNAFLRLLPGRINKGACQEIDSVKKYHHYGSYCVHDNNVFSIMCGKYTAIADDNIGETELDNLENFGFADVGAANDANNSSSIYCFNFNNITDKDYYIDVYCFTNCCYFLQQYYSDEAEEKYKNEEETHIGPWSYMRSGIHCIRKKEAQSSILILNDDKTAIQQVLTPVQTYFYNMNKKTNLDMFRNPKGRFATSENDAGEARRNYTNSDREYLIGSNCIFNISVATFKIPKDSYFIPAVKWGNKDEITFDRFNTFGDNGFHGVLYTENTLKEAACDVMTVGSIYFSTPYGY